MSIPKPLVREEITLKIDDLSRGGAGVGREASGRAVFVPLTAPGDRVRVRVLQSKKNYAQGELIEILERSPERIEPRCAVFGKCGGCEWQHIPYSLQWQTKVKGALHALSRTRAIDAQASSIPVQELPAEEVWSYRNRVQFRGLGGKIGFFARGSRDLVAIERCEIAREEINQAIPGLRKEGTQKGREYKVEAEVDMEGRFRSAWNQGHAAFGFRQIHDGQNAKLRAWIAHHLSADRVLYDLFGGNGNLSIPLAEKMKAVHCIDVQAKAPPGLKIPARYEFHAVPVISWLLKRSQTKTNAREPASAIIDPPREGLGDDLVEVAGSLERLGVTELIAIGCDADNWARDVSRWKERGWNLRELGVLDLFPQTHHVECLAFLDRK